MAVVVSLAGADERDPRGQAAGEVGVLGRGAVVGDLEHVDRPQRPAGRRLLLTAQRRLPRRFQVTGGEHPQPVDLHEQRDAGVVRRVPLLTPGLGQPARPDDPPRDVPRGTGRAGPGGHRREPVLLEQRRRPRRLRTRLGEGADERALHRAALEHPRQPADVVGVEVAEHEQVHAPDVESPQAAVHRAGVRAGVDDDGGARP